MYVAGTGPTIGVLEAGLAFLANASGEAKSKRTGSSFERGVAEPRNRTLWAGRLGGALQRLVLGRDLDSLKRAKVALAVVALSVGVASAQTQLLVVDLSAITVAWAGGGCIALLGAVAVSENEALCTL